MLIQRLFSTHTLCSNFIPFFTKVPNSLWVTMLMEFFFASKYEKCNTLVSWDPILFALVIFYPSYSADIGAWEYVLQQRHAYFDKMQVIIGPLEP